MNRRNELLLLDTGILIHLIRGNEVAQRVDAAFHIRHRTERPLISIVTIGEALSLAVQFGWSVAKRETLEGLLRELVIVNIDTRAVAEKFAEFHAWTRSIGRVLSHNDLWIAATAAAIDAHLVTTDGDFDVLSPDRIRRTLVAERSL